MKDTLSSMDQEFLYKFSSDALHKFTEYWNQLTPERKSDYFWNNDVNNIIAEGEITINRQPVRLTLSILRLDRSLPPHIYAGMSSHGIKISIMAFRLTHDLEVNEANITSLTNTYIEISNELWREIRDYI